jgi:hypothetical protein
MPLGALYPAFRELEAGLPHGSASEAMSFWRPPTTPNSARLASLLKRMSEGDLARGLECRLADDVTHRVGRAQRSNRTNARESGRSR